MRERRVDFACLFFSGIEIGIGIGMIAMKIRASASETGIANVIANPTLSEIATVFLLLLLPLLLLLLLFAAALGLMQLMMFLLSFRDDVSNSMMNEAMSDERIMPARV